VIAPGYVTPWAAPGMPAKVLRHLVRNHAPVRISWPLSAAEMRWMWQWRQACQLDTYLANRERMQRLAFYSRERLHWLTDSLQLEYDRSAGYLVLLRSEKDQRLVQPSLQVLREAGVAFHEIDAEKARAVEPALNPDTAFLGAVHLPEDGAANCRQFAILLKRAAVGRGRAVRVPHQSPAAGSCQSQDAGPRSRWPAAAAAGLPGRRRVRRGGIGTAAASAGRARAARAGLGLFDQRADPRATERAAQRRDGRALQGCHHAARPPRARGGQRGDRRRSDGASARLRCRPLYRVLHDWFPGAAQLSNTCTAVQEWKGARPMLPDGPPILGASGIPGVWVNLGHGSSGWALACGSARVVADLMSGHAPQLDIEGLGMERLLR
jgi:D-amino-acid dehydrogenase